MKLSKQKLKQIIKEELAKVLEAHGGAHKKDDPESADETDEESEDEIAPLKLPKYDPETRKRFRRQQSQKRDLARHIKGRRDRAARRKK